MNYCNTCGHEKICGCNQWKDLEKEELVNKLAIAVEAMEMGAFHHGGCQANWYKEDLKTPRDCTCAREKVTKALKLISGDNK